MAASILQNINILGDGTLKKTLTKVSIACVSIALVAGSISCGGSSGGSINRDNAALMQGTLSSGSAVARTLAAGEGGIAGVEVSALGSTSTTDENGNFTFLIDGDLFTGGAVEYTFLGQGIDTQTVLEDVPGGPGAVSNVDFVLEESGDITGEVSDVEGNILFTTPGGGSLGCSTTSTFSDGGGGALWKPHSEGTGTVVVLMPPEYQNAEVEVFNNRNEVVATPLRRNCCSHNGGREHVYLTHTSGALAGVGTPLTVRFRFSDGFTDCRTVPDPNQRYD